MAGGRGRGGLFPDASMIKMEAVLVFTWSVQSKELSSNTKVIKTRPSC